MNIDKVKGLILETEKALKSADDSLQKLAKLPNAPHNLLVEPTIKLRDRILEDMEELLEIKARMEA